MRESTRTVVVPPSGRGSQDGQVEGHVLEGLAGFGGMIPMGSDGDSSSIRRRPELAGQTFLFADLSGFTALTEAHGDQQAADLVGAFCQAVRRLLAQYQAQEVKAIGDALMLRVGDAAAAIPLGLTIVHDIGEQHGFPLVRVGMHTGPAVERDGDWFGMTVNLAARVSAAASGGEALLTAATKAAAGEVQGVELRERGRRAFRNVGEPVEVYVAVRQGARDPSGLPVDPVCRMAVDPWHGAGRLIHEGVEYCFCSLGCAGAFAQHPSAYTATDDRSHLR
jgi:adenylate cyclase